MQFGKPHYFWLLGLIPLLIVFYWIVFQRRKSALERFSGKILTQKLLIAVSSLKQKLKAILIILVFIFLIFTLTEPKWGFHIEEVRREGIDMVIALDISKSMLAEDLKPSRMVRATLEIESLLEQLTGDRVGLVAFAGSAFIQCPLTLDYATIRLFLNDLDIYSIPRGGTDIGGAIRKSVEAFEGSSGGEKIILLLTDGEDHGGQLTVALKEAKALDITVYPIGIGRDEGAPIPSVDSEGKIQYLRNREGEIVLSKLDPRLLEKIAVLSGGSGGIIGHGDFSLEELYRRKIAKLEKEELSSQQKKEYHHRFQWPLVLAVSFLYMEGLLRERR